MMVDKMVVVEEEFLSQFLSYLLLLSYLNKEKKIDQIIINQPTNVSQRFVKILLPLSHEHDVGDKSGTRVGGDEVKIR